MCFFTPFPSQIISFFLFQGSQPTPIQGWTFSQYGEILIKGIISLLIESLLYVPKGPNPVNKVAQMYIRWKIS